MSGRIDAAKWSEGKAMAGTIATGIRAYTAEPGSNGNYGDNRPTYAEMGFMAEDFNTNYFTTDNFSWNTDYDSTGNRLIYSITISKTDEIASPASWTLKQDGSWTAGQ